MKISPWQKRYLSFAGTAFRVSIQFGFVPLMLYLALITHPDQLVLEGQRVWFLAVPTSSAVTVDAGQTEWGGMAVPADYEMGHFTIRFNGKVTPYVSSKDRKERNHCRGSTCSSQRRLLNDRRPTCAPNRSPLAVLFLSCVLFLLLYLRRLYLRRSFRHGPTTRRSSPTSICVVLGSGGHTTEILRLMQALPSERYSPRFYVLADTDSTSLERLEAVEGNAGEKRGDYKIFRIPRSREVRQSYASSVISTLVSMLRCAPLVFDFKCDVLLCNGPGTCVPVCFFAYIYNLLLFRRCQIIFIESMCRVESLSTTGKILYYLGIADEVLVQWPQLSKKHPCCVYLGRLV